MPIRVSAHPVFSRAAKLLQTLHGGSHHHARRSDNTLNLPGNCSIFGPAQLTKKGDQLVVEVLPGGQLMTSQLGLQLQNIEEVLGDAEGRLACILSAEHVEVCGEMELDAGVPFIDRVHKLVLSVSKLREGQVIKVPAGGNVHYPVSVQPRCDDCTCRRNREVEWGVGSC